MAFRNVVIENPVRIRVKNNQLLITTDREYSLPAEDLSALLLESRQSTITTAALSLLGQSGCALFVCDEKHRNKLKQNLPDNGSVRLLVITEKQYESIDILVGRLTQADESFQCEQLSIF